MTGNFFSISDLLTTNESVKAKGNQNLEKEIYRLLTGMPSDERETVIDLPLWCLLEMNYHFQLETPLIFRSQYNDIYQAGGDCLQLGKINRNFFKFACATRPLLYLESEYNILQLLQTRIQQLFHEVLQFTIDTELIADERFDLLEQRLYKVGITQIKNYVRWFSLDLSGKLGFETKKRKRKCDI